MSDEPKYNDSGVSETLGYDVINELKGPDGAELEPYHVPRLGAFAVLELEPRVVKQFQKVLTAQRSAPEVANSTDDKDPKVIAAKNAVLLDLMSILLDKEGIDLMIDVLQKTLGMDKPTIERMFDKNSVEALYGFIVRRNFKLQDVLNSFNKRFASMFGVEEANPTIAAPQS
jgi:hypothetical protein